MPGAKSTFFPKYAKNPTFDYNFNSYEYFHK